MKSKLLIITGNKMKFEELSLTLNEYFDCEQQTLNEPEIQGSPEEILHHKLNQAFNKFKSSVLVDDTSVHFAELNGFPGPYIRDFLKYIPTYEMGKKFKGGRINIVCRLGIMRGTDDVIIGIGSVHGDVVDPKNEDPGPREFDLFVQVDGTDRPMLEYSIEEKNKFSHRGLAMKNLIEILEKESK